jgi:phage regulator Rha-like protein
VDVSAEWSQWLHQHRAELRSIHMLTGSKFIQLTADFVRRFAQLGELMRIYTEPASFEQALQTAVTIS